MKKKKSKLYKRAKDKELGIKITGIKLKKKQLSGCFKTLGGQVRKPWWREKGRKKRLSALNRMLVDNTCQPMMEGMLRRIGWHLESLCLVAGCRPKTVANNHACNALVNNFFYIYYNVKEKPAP